MESPIGIFALCGIKLLIAADLYIEDSPDNIQKLRDDGHKTIVFTNSTNEGLPGPRANSWDEIEGLVLAELEKWQGEGSGRQKSLSGR
jgi:5'(3')-deoxyribonucleotidase